MPGSCPATGQLWSKTSQTLGCVLPCPVGPSGGFLFAPASRHFYAFFNRTTTTTTNCETFPTDGAVRGAIIQVDGGIPATGPDDCGDSHERVWLVSCLATTEPGSGPVLWPAGHRPDRVCRPRRGERVARLAQTTCRVGMAPDLGHNGRAPPVWAFDHPRHDFVLDVLGLSRFGIRGKPRTQIGIGTIDACRKTTDSYR